ncbi:MAG: porin [Hyphomicrobiales bacterium]|nr:porin [Hyphomicrobiales bacterium]
MSANLRTGVLLLSFGAATFPASSEEGYDKDGKPLEYVRVCDTYGTGYFYIPGTETCLQIGGYAGYQRVQSPSVLGVGTVVGGGPERFVAKVDNWLDSFGGGGGFEYGLGEGEGGLLGRGGAIYNQFVYGDANLFSGNASSSGSARNGVDGVTMVGLTFAEFDGSTGIGAGSAGFGVTGSTKIDYLGGLGQIGYGRSYGFADSPMKPVYVWRGGLYYEGMEYDSKGSADLTFNDTPYGGYFQDYDYDSEDEYMGFAMTGEVRLRPVDRLNLKVTGYVKVGYHWGEAEFNQTTGIGGGTLVMQDFHYENDGFVVGGGLSVNADYAISPTWTIGASYQFDLVPDVTTVYAPENPSEQPIGFSGESVQKHTFTIRVAASFN